jgi:ribose transport system ATP-binding protein
LTTDAARSRGPVPRLRARGLTKSFAGSVVLDEFDLDVDAGQIHALVGENGSGKSTFIKILSGYHRPDHGQLAIDGEPMSFGSAEASLAHGCRFVHQDLGLVDTLSVLDNLHLGRGYQARWGTIRRREADRTARDMLARVQLDLDPGRLTAELSPAVKTGVAIARALRDSAGQPARLLVLDEPTANLPLREVEQLLAIIRAAAAGGVSVLYVTHRLDEVFEIANSVTVLRDGRKVATVPAADLDHRGLVRLLIGTELDQVRVESQRIRSDHQTAVLRVTGLAAGPLRSLSLDVHPGDVVGVAGITGSGRETVLSAIFGGLTRDSGEVTVDGTQLPPGRPDRSMELGVAYMPAERKQRGGFMDFSARENLTLTDLRPFWQRGLLRSGRERAEVKTWFTRLNVRPAGAFDAPLSSFSGGNQQKILFGKWLRCSPRVLLLDEPTQGVDIGAKADLHREILRAASGGAAVVISSSDLDELLAICRRVLVIRDGTLAANLSGDDMTVAKVTEASLAGSEVQAL